MGKKVEMFQPNVLSVSRYLPTLYGKGMSTDEASPDTRDSLVRDLDDDHAELIARLTPEDVERLWSVLIRLKPYLKD